MAVPAGSRPRRPRRVLVALALAAACVAGCTQRAEATVLSVTPAAGLVDQPVAVSVRGLPGGARTTLTTTATDAGGTGWSATARFKATAAGVVSLTQPSLGGSWTGVNPRGLFELMTPPATSEVAQFMAPPH
jgi:Acyl-CoA thioester hydrolase/BAAT N-terminal region